MFLVGGTPAENVEHVKLKQTVAMLSFATDHKHKQFCNWPKLSIATVATNHVAAAKLGIATVTSD